VKNKGIALAVCIALAGPKIAAAETFTGIAAMNLGDINSRSYLDEHFSGSIPILYTSAKEALAFKARLAPDAVFDDLGVERLPILKSLQFNVKIHNGKPYVAIKSSKAIDLPFLSFVVEVYSPEGSIYQDYTVLLDPRHFSAKNTFTNVEQSSKTKSSIVPSVKKSVADRSNTVKTSRPKRLRVKAGDTLSKIANIVQLDGISNKNMSLAIFLQNPRAFSGNNVNKLKKGVSLKIPTFDEVNEFIQRKPLLTNPLKKLEVSSSKEPSVTKKSEVKAKAAIKNQGAKTIKYRVKRGDSLSAIARKFATKSASFSTMMTIIHRANPHAFTHNKVNLLKKGATLKIPSDNSFKLETNEKEALSAKPDQLETAINLSLHSLEKRLREIRKTLKSTKAELFDLKLTLKNKDILIERQSKNIRILKKKLQKTEQATLIGDEKSTLAEPSQQRFIEKSSSDNKISVSELVTYSGLMLLVGLVLLRVGRQKYAEKMVASDDYVATVNIDPKLAIEELNFTKTLTEAAKNSDRTMTDLSMQEAEQLVDELVDELDCEAALVDNDTAIEDSGNIKQNIDSPLDSWIMESAPQKSQTNEVETDLKAEIINNLEKTMEKRLQNKTADLKVPLQPKHATLEIDLERHLQSINDQIIADKMKDPV